MPTYNPPLKNTEYIFYISLVSQSNTKIFQANPTLAAGDFKVSVDGGTLNNLTTLPAVTPASSKMVKVTLSTTEMNGDNITLVCNDAAGDEWCDLVVNLQTVTNQFDALSTQTAVDGLNDLAVADILDATVEGSITLEGALRLMLAVLAGKSSGGGTTSIAFRDIGDSKNRIAATVDGDGNRSAVTLDSTD